MLRLRKAYVDVSCFYGIILKCRSYRSEQLFVVTSFDISTNNEGIFGVVLVGTPCI